MGAGASVGEPSFQTKMADYYTSISENLLRASDQICRGKYRKWGLFVIGAVDIICMKRKKIIINFN